MDRLNRERERRDLEVRDILRRPKFPVSDQFITPIPNPEGKPHDPQILIDRQGVVIEGSKEIKFTEDAHLQLLLQLERETGRRGRNCVTGGIRFSLHF